MFEEELTNAGLFILVGAALIGTMYFMSGLQTQLNTYQSDYSTNSNTVIAIESSSSTNIPYGKPFDRSIIVTSSFGYRTSPITHTKSFHRGIDLKCKSSTPILATASGIVSFAGYRRGYGNCVVINHGNGYKTTYAHLSTVLVRKKQRVNDGGLIGYSGNTGSSTGPHLHYELAFHNKPINPYTYLKH